MNSNARPNFWRRLLLAFVKTMLAILIVGSLATGGFLAFREIQRSFDSVTTKVEINRRDLEAVQRDVQALGVESSDRQREIEALKLEAEGVAGRLEDLEGQIAGELEQHQQLLTSLEARMSAAENNGDAALERIEVAASDGATMGSAIVALQSDLNESNSRIDALGGEIDGLRSENARIDGSVADLSQLTASALEAAADIDEMRQTLAIFHVWELVARARLRLLENNLGLAAADVERAFRAIDALVAAGLEGDDDTLNVIQTRLALSYNGLPDRPVVAALDLENAWDELGRMLTSRLLPELVFAEESEASVLTPEEVTPEPTSAPAPTATPTPRP